MGLLSALLSVLALVGLREHLSPIVVVFDLRLVLWLQKKTAQPRTVQEYY
jgi:hypothetical protein